MDSHKSVLPTASDNRCGPPFSAHHCFCSPLFFSPAVLPPLRSLACSASGAAGALGQRLGSRSAWEERSARGVPETCTQTCPKTPASKPGAPPPAPLPHPPPQGGAAADRGLAEPQDDHQPRHRRQRGGRRLGGLPDKGAGSLSCLLAGLLACIFVCCLACWLAGWLARLLVLWSVLVLSIAHARTGSELPPLHMHIHAKACLLGKPRRRLAAPAAPAGAYRRPHEPGGVEQPPRAAPLLRRAQAGRADLPHRWVMG